jgi:hypothetical protein
VPIREPFQGERIGPFTVLAPSPARYLQLVIESEKTPQRSVRSKSIVDAIIDRARPVIQFLRAEWGSERFSYEPTSVENEISVVQYAKLCGHRILLTGDAGRDAMTEAADVCTERWAGVARHQQVPSPAPRRASKRLVRNPRSMVGATPPPDAPRR